MCERWNVPSCCVSCRRSRPTSRSRLVKTPKVFLRDAGILHALLRLETDNDLLGHPVYGSSWEGYVLEQVLGVLGGQWEASFFRTSDGSECDLVLQRGRRRLAIECKASSAPERAAVCVGGVWAVVWGLVHQETESGRGSRLSSGSGESGTLPCKYGPEMRILGP